MIIFSKFIIMPGPQGHSKRNSLLRKCCGPAPTNTKYICEKCKHRPCCQMNYVPTICNCCLAKHKLKLCCSLQKIACAHSHRVHSEFFLPNRDVDGSENGVEGFDKSERTEIHGQRGNISIDETDVQTQTVSDENNEAPNEFNWNDKKSYIETVEKNSKFTDDYDYNVIKPPPKVWNISEKRNTVPKICFKTEWYLENTKEFLPENACECELCMKERDKSSMNAFKNYFSCCRKEKTVYSRYRRVPVPDFSESEDEQIEEKLKRSVGGGKNRKRKRNRR